MMRAFRILSLAAVLAAGSAVSAMAVEVDFGNLVPSPGGCTHSGTDPGFVCNSPQSFSASGATFTAVGFNSPFNQAAGGSLTIKPFTDGLGPPFNTFQESGIGHNQTATPTACTDPDCEIAQTFGVSIQASQPMNDAIIGSVQTGEQFNFFTGSSIAGLTFFGTFTGGTCAPDPGFADTCLINFPDASFIGVQQNNAGDVLITAVSGNFTTSAPEPASLALFGSALIAFGIFRRRRSM